MLLMTMTIRQAAAAAVARAATRLQTRRPERCFARFKSWFQHICTVCVVEPDFVYLATP